MRLLTLSVLALLLAVEATKVRSTSSNRTATVKRFKKEPPRDCSDAPDINIKKSCLMYHKMDRMARKRLARQAAMNQVVNQPGGPPNWLTPLPVPANARGQFAYHPYDCMTISCICPFFNGNMQNGNCILSTGFRLDMAYRKEYRMLTEDERRRWHNALNTLKRNGEYDRISRQHLEVGVGSGAHSGPGFLPWHREYLKRFEVALRMVDPLVAIPYWDSVMDSYLPDPRDSIMFSNLFAGETDLYGNVVQGPFAYWPTLEGRSTILRQLGHEGSLFSEQQVNVIVSQSGIEDTLAYTAPAAGCPYPNNYGAIEYIHSNIHLWIGGDMKPPSTSANEPIFFMHHSFVDYLWELWRQLRQPRWLRELAYSQDHGFCANWQHFSYANMRPFPYLQNRDGLSNGYTDHMYRYAPRPTCSHANPTCGSPYLFCDIRGYPHCVAKIKMNGICRGFENFDSCYQGRCWWGRCIPAGGMWRMAGVRMTKAGNETVEAMSELPELKTVKPKVVPMAAKLFADCFNRHSCCEAWADAGHCQKSPEYMSQYCAASCDICLPQYNTTSDVCSDRHLMCKNWKSSGMCRGESAEFMAENCRATCGKCLLSKDAQCFSNGRLIKLPATQHLVESIRDSFEPKVQREIAAARRRRGSVSETVKNHRVSNTV